jgi:hypothetical protein
MLQISSGRSGAIEATNRESPIACFQSLNTLATSAQSPRKIVAKLQRGLAVWLLCHPAPALRQPAQADSGEFPLGGGAHRSRILGANDLFCSH